MLELEVPAASLASQGHSQPSPRARRQRRQQNEVVARSQVVTTKNSTMEFSSKGRQKERGRKKKILILPDKGAVRRKGGNSPTEGARGDIGSFPSNSPKEAQRAEPITGGQRDPILFISILPFPAKGRDQIPSGWPLDTASRELLQNYSSRREMQGREPRTHRAPPQTLPRWGEGLFPPPVPRGLMGSGSDATRSHPQASQLPLPSAGNARNSWRREGSLQLARSY